MYLRLTKEEYILLIRLIVEGQNEIIIKKAYGMKAPNEYTIDNYMNLWKKIKTFGEEQKLNEEEISKALNNDDFEKLEEKVRSTKLEKGTFSILLINELMQNQFGKFMIENIVNELL